MALDIPAMSHSLRTGHAPPKWGACPVMGYSPHIRNTHLWAHDPIASAACQFCRTWGCASCNSRLKGRSRHCARRPHLSACTNVLHRFLVAATRRSLATPSDCPVRTCTPAYIHIIISFHCTTISCVLSWGKNITHLIANWKFISTFPSILEFRTSFSRNCEKISLQT